MSIDSVQELIDWQPPPQKSIISDGILNAGTGMIVFGDAGSWKSILALHTAYCLATGTDWFGYTTAKSTAFKYQAELPKAIDRERLIKYMNGYRPANMLLKTNNYVSLDSTYGKSSMDKDLQIVMSRCPDTHIVLILDPIYLMISGHVSDEYDIKRFLFNLNELKTKYPISIIIIHHVHKTRVDSSGNVIDTGAEEIMGSSYFNNWADTMVRVKLLNPSGNKDRVTISFDKVRHATRPLAPFQVKWDRSNLRPTVYNRIQLDTDELTVKGLV